ncbi:GNAT family N-acetyltransferase [Pseudolysinimonas sp.]
MTSDDVQRFRARNVPNVPPRPPRPQDQHWPSDGLEVWKLEPEDPHRPPFTPGVPGFTPEWWEDRIKPFDRPTAEWFLSFTEDGIEVARGIVFEDVRLHPKFVGLTDRGPHVEIVRFEVRDGYRGSGIGRQAIDAIVAQFPGRRLFAFSKDADDFWNHVGWTLLVRSEPDSMTYPTYSTVADRF